MKLDNNLSLEERMKRIKAEVAREKEFLSNLAFDPTTLIEVVKTYVDKWDPMQLLEMDSPEDEYEGEIRTISIYMIQNSDNLTVEKLEQKIRAVFEKAFDERFAQNQKSIEAATGIFTALRNHQIGGEITDNE